MKKLFKIILYSFGFLVVLGLIIMSLENLEIIEPTTKPELSEQVKKNREAYMKNWDKGMLNKGGFVGNTLVIVHRLKTNPFINKNDFAMEFHPEIVQGVTCESLGVEYIQIRSIHHDDLLSGIVCEERK